MVDLLIRSPKKSEARKLASIFALSFGITNVDKQRMEELIKTFQTEMEKQLVAFLVAIIRNRIVALGGEARYGGASYLGYIGVNPGHRRKGIGSSITRKLVERSLQHNDTIELFSNPGVENLYRQFGFKDEFQTHLISLNGSSPLITGEKADIIAGKNIPGWILDLDKQTVGFNRSRLLHYLMEYKKAKLSYIDQKGYVLYTDMAIGPVIARDELTAVSLIEHSHSTGSKRIIIPEHALQSIKHLSPIVVQTCLKMTRGKPLKAVKKYAWGYHSFATS